ncbi:MULTISPECIES: hypothetical protein [unclassified Nocardioides]|uniref:hypothetical protein n=1 Tax=unclassified Nocardioides TaxID=2615069 RepID=UPI0006FACB26|nr:MULTISPECIES: hypothetical protein [unclassified Nocardioides]KRA37688.1 hypothetical protein ASD81_03025 [Nocardioides sp. Root614]KRA91648.1 hypothetical protein ASD84_03290 [Nocardioides sp. Root682]
MNQSSDTQTTPPLNSFDHALLRELRVAVAENRPAPARSRRTRWTVAAGGVAAATITAVGLSSMNPAAAAYAVERSDSGDITITIHELDDSEGLEKALAEHGIEAEVDYDAAGATLPGAVDHELPDAVAPDLEGGAQSSSTSGSATIEGAAPGNPASSPCGDMDAPPLKSGVNGDDYVITIPRDSAILSADAVLQIRTSGNVDGSFSSLGVDYAVDGVQCGFGSAQATAVPAG